MSLSKDKTGKHMHVNYSEIINWTPILHNKAWLPLTHPPPYLKSTLPVSTSSLSSPCCSTSRIRGAKSATITSISSGVLKKESKRRVQAVGKNLPAFSERVCLCRSSREGRREFRRTRFQQGRLYFYWLSFEIPICIWKEKTGALNWFQHECLIISSASMCPFSYLFRLRRFSESQAHSNVKSHGA